MFKLITAILMAYCMLFFWFQMRPPKVVHHEERLYVSGRDVIGSYAILGALVVFSYAFLTGIIS